MMPIVQREPTWSPVASTLRTDSKPRQQIYILRVIPARVAVWLVSFVLLAWSICLATGGWITVTKLDKKLSDSQRLIIYFHIMNYVFVGICSFVGLAAAATNSSPKRSQLFAGLLFGHFIFGVISGAFCLHIIFTHTTSPERIASCISVIATAAWSNLCHRGALVKGLSLGVFEFAWMSQILAIYVSIRYTSQLREEEDQKPLDSPLY